MSLTDKTRADSSSSLWSLPKLLRVSSSWDEIGLRLGLEMKVVLGLKFDLFSPFADMEGINGEVGEFDAEARELIFFLARILPIPPLPVHGT